MTLARSLLARVLSLGVVLALALTTIPAEPADEAPATDPDLVVLIGRYSCTASNTYISIDEPPITVLGHSIAFSGTGFTVQPRRITGPARRKAGPGSQPLPEEPPLPSGLINNLGLSTSVGLGQGTPEQCVAVAESIAAAAGERGCVSSPVRADPTPTISVLRSAGFTMICEGKAADQLRTIGDLSRAVVLTELP